MVDADSIFSKRVVLVVGKGGVGRTTVSAALAQAAANLGLDSLVTEIVEPDSEHSEDSALAHAFGRTRLKADPVLVAPRVSLCHLLPRRGQEAFLSEMLPGEAIAKAALRSRALKRFLSTVPSFQEMGVFYHLLMLIRARNSDGSYKYPFIVVDMPATGHALALTNLPELLLQIIGKGPIARTLREGQSFFYDKEKSAAWVVTLPETLPVTESLELIEGLLAGKVHVAGVLLNNMVSDPFSVGDHEALSGLLKRHHILGEHPYLAMRSSQTAAERLHVSTSLPILELPRCETSGASLVRQLADHLTSHEMGRSTL